MADFNLFSDENPDAVDPSTGLTNAQKRMIGFNTIGSIGAALLAAGEKQMPADRAKYLAQLGNVPNQMTQQMAAFQNQAMNQAKLADYKSQAGLREAQMRQAQQQLAMQQRIMNMFAPSQGATQAVPNAVPGVQMPTAVGGGASAGAPVQMPQTALAPAQAALAAPLPSQGVLSNMDPNARALLMLGAVSKPEEAGKALLGAQQTANEPTSFMVTDQAGRVRSVQTTKGQAPALMQQYQSQGFTLGKPEYNEEQTTRLKALGEQNTAIDHAAIDAQEMNKRLTQMDIARAGFTPGAGADKYYQAAAWMNSILPDEFLPKNMSADKVASYQDFTKQATLYATDQARKMGAREAASVVNMMVRANPNAEMMPQAIEDIQNGLRAQNDYVIAKADAKDQYLKDKGSLEGFDSFWRKSASPEQFMLKYIPPARLKTLPDSVLKQLMGG